MCKSVIEWLCDALLLTHDDNSTQSITIIMYMYNTLTNDGTLSVDNTLHTILTVHTSVVPSHVPDHHHL